jgi:hypothetical protein
MTATLTRFRLAPEQAAALHSLLDDEWREYRRLLRLAVRQNRYMRRQDVRRMESNACEWRRYMPLADGARRRREQFLRELGERMDLDEMQLKLSRLAEGAEGHLGDRLRACLAGWCATTGALVRQNSLNAVLARFCLDLVGNETEIFRRAVGEDPGCYEAGGGRLPGRAGGVIEQRA